MAEGGAWTASPEKSRRYWIHDRWSDYRAGRADGRAGIPRVSPELTARLVAHSTPPRSDETLPHGVPLSVPSTTLPAAVMAPDALSPGNATAPESGNARLGLPLTPYLDGLRNARNEELARVRYHYELNRAQLGQELFLAKTRREPSAIAMGLASSRLEDLSHPLTPAELSRRGPAEQDERQWPAEMLAERRRRAWQLLLHQAQQDLRTATAELSVAELAVEQADQALADRLRVAQAAGWQIVHHYGRREARYLRSLARSHEMGPELVKLLDLAGPDLPEWLLIASEKEER
jgi:hypothetical protein